MALAPIVNTPGSATTAPNAATILNTWLAQINSFSSPVVLTYAELVAQYPAANYVGFAAVCTDVGLVSNPNGVAWTLPLTEGQNYGPLTASFSPAASDRYPLGLNGQEMSVTAIGSVTYFYYTGGTGQILYTTNTTGNYTDAPYPQGVIIFGGGVGGYTNNIGHSYVLQVGTDLYLYFIDLTTQNIAVAHTTTSAPTVFTYVGIVYTGVVGGGAANGNCCVVPYNGTYYLLQESLFNTTNPVEGATNSFQINCLTCATPTGTFASPVFMSSLMPSPNGSASGAWCQVFNNPAGVPTACIYYHGGTWGRQLPEDIYCATMPASQLGTDNWTITNAQPIPIVFSAPPSGTGPATMKNPWFKTTGNNYQVTLSTGQIIPMTTTLGGNTASWTANVTGSPTVSASVLGLFYGNPAVMTRKHYFELDQIADPFLFQSPNGQWWMGYEACNNRAPWFQLMVTPLLPTPNFNDNPYTYPVEDGRNPLLPYWNADDPWTYSNIPLPMTTGMANGIVNAAKVTGTWALVATTGAPGGVIRTNTSGAVGDLIEYDVELAPGTYTMSMNVLQQSTGAIGNANIYDGKDVGVSTRPISFYAASPTYANVTITNFNILGTEPFHWRFRIVAAAGTGGGFTMADCGFTLQRTGP